MDSLNIFCLGGLSQADDDFLDVMKEEGRGLRPACDVLGQVTEITYVSMRRQGEKLKHADKKRRAIMR
jgi:hypothetical protein